MSKDKSPTAFPFKGFSVNSDHPGMTLRQWYAGLAMPVAVAELYRIARENDAPIVGGVAVHAARYAFEVADAMLAAGDEP